MSIQSNKQVGKKFYFLEYFYILLKSAELFSNREQVFENFKELKKKNLLGESKYKKLTVENEQVIGNKLNRYTYTFQQVITESSNYNLVRVEDGKEGKKILLTELGAKALVVYQKSKYDFNKFIFKLMEKKHLVFYQLVDLCYKANKSKNGLLIFPIYSPRKLGFEKEQMTKSKHIFLYSKKLRKKLESDIVKYTNKKLSLEDNEKQVLNKLIEDGLISSVQEDKYDIKKYNVITSRLRKFWLNFFLRNLYDYRNSFDTFNVWVERGKQLGIVHTTEFYPNFDGRVVFPTSIIVNGTSSSDFEEMFEYPNNKKLYVHRPIWDEKMIQGKSEAQENFVSALVDSYFDIRKSRKTHFIRLSDLREKVCYKMRIPSFVFDDFLMKTYQMNLKGKDLKIQISLEADRLPQETNAMYLKREPVLINGKYKNIIAIDYKKK